VIPSAVLAGIVFAVGLVVADMTSPGRIIGFLDITGAWDPTLAFVMVGAIGVYAPIARIARKRRPLFAREMHWPEPSVIDTRLVGGAAMFGIGWGLSGFCPGPALVATGTGRGDTLIFVGTMVAGIAIVKALALVLVAAPRNRRTDS